MRWRLARLRGRSAAGAGTLEYVSAVAIASVLVGAVVVALTGVRIEGIAERAICSVKAVLGGSRCSLGDTTPPPQKPPFDPKPKKRKTAEHSEKVNSEIQIAFIKIGENAGLLQTTYSDGTVTFTATDGAEVGVTGGFGGKLDIGKLERGQGRLRRRAQVRVRQHLDLQECRRGRGHARAARQVLGGAGDAQARHLRRVCDLPRDSRRHRSP
jgi:hypothetical protein